MRIIMRLVVTTLFFLFTWLFSRAQSVDSLKYPIKDRRADRYSNYNSNPFYLNDSTFVKQDVHYDSKTKEYYIIEKVGKSYYRKPISMTFDEFWKIRGRQMEVDNFKKRSNTSFTLNRKLVKPKLRIFDNLFNRTFGLGTLGLGKIDIKPQGSVDILAGYQGQNTKNPTLPERARKYGTFDFNMNSQFNLNANIGDKLKLPINYNTLANFDFENQLKLDYSGKEDEMLKKLEAGNISFANKGTLMPGAQALFGVKTQLQFGKLFVTTALANQKSQRQSQAFQGGASTQTFEKKLDDYDENRHFLLAQYFKEQYNNVMSKLPVAQSQVNILRLEVWVTNRNGSTTDARDVVAFMDLGENKPYNPLIQGISNSTLPTNGANTLYSAVVGNQAFRNPSTVSSSLNGLGLLPVQDYEKTFARKLNPTEYTFNQQAGFISLNTTLQPDEVLGVAFQYTYNGRTYQVGEFAQDVPSDTSKGVQKVLFLKLLKATSQRTNLPIWDLMMKNIYSLDINNIQRDGFRLNILYQEPSGGEKRYLPEGTASGRNLLSVLKLDRLNNNNDPQPDGVFDYIEGFTIQSQYGRIIFPVLEPFGRDLDQLAFNGNLQSLKDKYVYYALYDTIKAIAQQNYAQLNRFIMRGNAKGANSNEIYLNAFNIPPGSVTVTAGGQTLKEGVDYSIDYNLGRVEILNEAIKTAGLPINVNFENNAGFGVQNRGFFGMRLDYMANKKLQLGGSMMRLNERPFFTKMNYGEDPIRNTMYGVDFSYKSQSKGLTRLLDKLPFYSTKTPSSITAYGEAALLKPGHPPQIGKGTSGLIYIDDFEGTRSNIDLRFPFVSWSLASTPAGAGFPEAIKTNDLTYGYNRAKLSWYQIEPVLQDPKNPNNPSKDRKRLSDPRVRAVDNSELFPKRSVIPGQNQLLTFDLNYYPKQRGPYNYDDQVGSVNADGTLNNPTNRWGGLMRSIDQTDFESNNVEFIEFWLQDPFIKNSNFPNGYTNSAGGKLIFNLGNISEDVVKDGRRFYENGLPTPTQPTLAVDTTTVWGKAPVNPIQLTQAFSNDPADRPYQDVGFDGLTDDEETKRRDSTLNNLKNRFGANSEAYLNVLKDPSNDNFVNYRDASYDAVGASILQRYKNYNNPQGNSQLSDGSSQVTAATLYPDNEDLNRDNTLNESEEYFEYEVDMRPQSLVVGKNYITDKIVKNITYLDGTTGTETWYQFRVPIYGYTRKVGNIPDFKSIRFMRMYLTQWQDSVNLRFAKLDLVRNQWRNFSYQLSNNGTYQLIPSNSPTTLNTLAVNVEENSQRRPIPYVIPPGIERVQSLAAGGINILQNEQAMSLQVRSLGADQARGVFKTLNLDLRQYKRMSMFIHAEELINTDPFYTKIENDTIYAVCRLGQDFLSNYYEVRIPLKITKAGSTKDTAIWPSENYLDFDLQQLIDIKNARNNAGTSPNSYYSQKIGRKTFAIYGNPNLGDVKAMLVSIYNPPRLDGGNISAEIWLNELRLSGLDEQMGWAAIGRVDMQLADLGALSFALSHRSIGFGTIEQKVNERSRLATTQVDFSTNLELGKLLPKAIGISIPMYASVSSTTRTPQYDPYDLDVKLRDKIRATSSDKKDSVRNIAIEKETTSTINFTNVKVQQRNGKKIKPWSLSNFDVTYSYLKQERHSPLVESDLVTKQRGVVGYNYSARAKYIEPFKKIIKSRTHWFDLIKDFNINLAPSLVSIRMDINRQFGRFIPRDITTYDKVKVDTTYDKYFNFDRFYAYRWDITRSFNFDFTATNKARVDQPAGELNTQEKKDSVKNNFLRGGRSTSYDQKVIFSYTLPLSKFPLTDWITARASYTAHYDWVASSLLAKALNQGNVIENNADKSLNGEFDFTRLYNKSRWLRALDEQAPQTSGGNVPKIKAKKIKLPKDTTSKAALAKKSRAERKLARKQQRIQKRQQRLNTPIQMNGVVRTVGRILTMVKRGSINYGESYFSRIPGYMDSTQYFGNNWRSMSPGLGYVLGKQPDSGFLNSFGRKGLLTHDSTFNLLFTQGYDQKLSAQMQLEPFKEFTIDLNLDKTFSKNYSELYKDTTGHSGLTHLSPYLTGGFSVSFISFNTLFEKYTPNELSNTFKRFQDNRLIIARRVAAQNPYWKTAGSQLGPDGFPVGYSRYSQDVLIPAFIAAYTKKDPNTIALIGNSNPTINTNPFKGIKPKPNWRLNFTGLTKIPELQKKFSAITITHAYTSKLSMNSFTSALFFQDPFRVGFPSFIDTISKNYIPYFLVPNITISEAFEPLLGIDVTTVNQLNAKVEYKKSRQLSLSLVDYQLSEVRSTEYSLSAGWRKRGFPLPFKLPKILNKLGGKKLDNDINFKLDFSVRDDVTSNNRLDQGSSIPTSGQKVIKISPSIDYVLNNRINIRLYYDRQHVKPYISSSAETINTRAGLQIRISLSQ